MEFESKHFFRPLLFNKQKAQLILMPFSKRRLQAGLSLEMLNISPLTGGKKPKENVPFYFKANTCTSTEEAS